MMTDTLNQLVVVRRDRFEAFAVLAQAYAGEPGVRLVWDRRRGERRGAAAGRAAVDRRRRDRRATPALAVNDYLMFTRELLREPGALAFVHRSEIADGAIRSAAVDGVRREIHAAAESDLPVLLTGGDTISRRALARRLHSRSERAARRFCAVNALTFVEVCEAWMRNESSELAGLAGGTVLIEDAAEWTRDVQARVCQCLEQVARARNVAGAPVRPAPVRLITASARPLIDQVESGEFSDDLFYRLNMIHLVLPPGVVRVIA